LKNIRKEKEALHLKLREHDKLVQEIDDKIEESIFYNKIADRDLYVIEQMHKLLV
jgi:hypothetical protein